jgi:hypothetical protein
VADRRRSPAGAARETLDDHGRRVVSEAQRAETVPVTAKLSETVS